MDLHIYSMRVYRCERTPFAQDASSSTNKKLRHVDIPFDESYAAARTWTQRITKELRVTKLEGYRFITDVDPEMHYLSKSILFRPVYLPQTVEDNEKMVRTCAGYTYLYLRQGTFLLPKDVRANASFS